MTPNWCDIPSPQPDSFGFHQRSVYSTAGGAVPVWNTWRVIATVRPCAPTVYIMVAVFASPKPTWRFPTWRAFTKEPLNGTPKNAGPLTSYSAPLQVPAAPVALAGIAQLGATSQRGAPEAS